jgi:hypothetical protein
VVAHNTYSNAAEATHAVPRRKFHDIFVFFLGVLGGKEEGEGISHP